VLERVSVRLKKGDDKRVFFAEQIYTDHSLVFDFGNKINRRWKFELITIRYGALAT
jgi:hypothetical protein